MALRVHMCGCRHPPLLMLLLLVALFNVAVYSISLLQKLLNRALQEDTQSPAYPVCRSRSDGSIWMIKSQVSNLSFTGYIHF